MARLALFTAAMCAVLCTAVALERYRSYLQANAAQPVIALEDLAAPVRAGRIPRAQSLYVIARIPLGQIEPTADAADFSRFREVEETLWTKSTTDEGLGEVVWPCRPKLTRCSDC